MLDEVERVRETDPRTRSILAFRAVGRGYIRFAQDEPNLLATAFLPIMPSAEAIEDPSPWHILAGALDDLAATGAMPPERRVGAETIAWSAVHGFAVLRAGHAFESSGGPPPTWRRPLLLSRDRSRWCNRAAFSDWLSVLAPPAITERSVREPANRPQTRQTGRAETRATCNGPRGASAEGRS
jgi:hypothetical protein